MLFFDFYIVQFIHTCIENTSGSHSSTCATDHGVVVIGEVCEGNVIQVPGDIWAGVSCQVHKQLHWRVVLLDQRVL